MDHRIQVDHEIEDIRKSIQKVQRVLYKIYRSMENVTGRVEEPLNAFDSALAEARNDVTSIRTNFSAIIENVKLII